MRSKSDIVQAMNPVVIEALEIVLVLYFVNSKSLKHGIGTILFASLSWADAHELRSSRPQKGILKLEKSRLGKTVLCEVFSEPQI
jgi:hypothetical protein